MSLAALLRAWQQAHNGATEERLYLTDSRHADAAGFPVIAALCTELDRVRRARGPLSPGEVETAMRRVLSVAVGEASERVRILLGDESHDGVPGLPSVPRTLAEREAACAPKLRDVPFEVAEDVGSIRYRLHPLDVGFDLREQCTAIEFGDEPEIRVSYPAEDHERRVMSGPRALVIARLEELGFRIAGRGTP